MGPGWLLAIGTHNYPEYERHRMSESEITIVEALENIALTDPISAVLFLVGGLITGVSMLVLGSLSFGSAVEFLTGQ